MNPQQPDNSAATAAMLTKALGYVENGGKPDVNNLKAGKSGELKSIFQYEPGTWAKDAKDVTGKSNLPLTPGNESLVTFNKVHKWLEEGKTPEQIFSMWNAGPGEPDAYTGKFSDGQNSVGVNHKGVKFNVPAYVKSGMHYFQQFQSEQGTAGQAPSPVAAQGVQPQQPPQRGGNPIENMVTAIQSKINPASTPTAVNPPLSQSAPQSKSKMGLIQGMLPQYGKYL